MKKILVIGIKGMAGHVVFKMLPQLGNYQVFGLARNIEEDTNTINLDVTNTDTLETILKENKFDAIINCIGILNKDAEDHPDKAIWFNSYFPRFLEAQTKATSTKVVHISTDCVFSGKKGGYTENDPKDGEGFYSQSNAFGELNNAKDVTLRTSIIGPDLNKNGIGLFNWFMKQEEGTQLHGFSKAFWSGITTIELAKAIHGALDQSITGLVQVTSKNKIDKYALLQLFNHTFKAGKITIVPKLDYEVDKSMISVRNDFKHIVPSYESMLNEMNQWISKNNYQY